MSVCRGELRDSTSHRACTNDADLRLPSRCLHLLPGKVRLSLLHERADALLIVGDDMGFADLAPYNTDAIQADTPTASRLAGEVGNRAEPVAYGEHCAPPEEGVGVRRIRPHEQRR